MSDMLAIGTIEGLKELGYEVPKDYSVVGFDGLEVTNYTDPAITTIDQNIQQRLRGYSPTVRYDPRQAQGTAAGIAPHPDGAQQRPPPIKLKSAVKAAFFRQRYKNVFAATS